MSIMTGISRDFRTLLSVGGLDMQDGLHSVPEMYRR